MDIEFVELEHRDNVVKLMEICGVDMNEAYNLYVDAGYDFEAAVNRKFNPPPEVPPPPQQIQPPIVNHFQQGFFPQPGLGFAGYEDEDVDPKYEEFKIFVANGVGFNKRYPVRKHEGLIKSWLPKFFKSDEEEVFKRDLQKFTGKRIYLKKIVGNLSQAYEWCWKEKFPLATIVLNFIPESRDALSVFSDEHFSDKILCEQFRVYGLNILTYDMEPELCQFYNAQRDANSIIVSRVNNVDEIQVVARIRLGEGVEELKKKLKMAKSECIQMEMEESHIVRQYNEERKGNFNYQRPKTIKENIKMREDRRLRQQQEEEFFKSCQPKKEEPRNSNPIEQRQPEKQQQKEKEPIKPQPKKEQPPKQSSADIKRQRENKLSSLPQYSSGIGFKIRAPSGENFIVQVSADEKIQYLFDFIESQPNELGFSNEDQRIFDLFIGFGGKETLRGKEGTRVGDLFEDSQVLIIRELVD